MDRLSLEALVWSPLWQLDFVGLAGIVVWHVISSRRPMTRLVAQITTFAAMTAILIANGITPFKAAIADGPDSMVPLLVSARLLWWIHLAWALIGLVRIYLVLDGHPHEARLLQDIVVGVVYLGVGLSILAFVFGIPIGTLVATSGVVAIILGLALQNTLGDVFSGIALTLGRPYVIGDWIVLSDGVEGRVAESTWRSTHILTGSNNVVVLPNSVLARLGVTNVSRPDGTHLLTLTVRVVPTHPPSAVMELMQAVLLSCGSIMTDPPPIVALKSLDAAALGVELQFRVASPAQRTRARSEVLDLVYRHCRSAGLSLAMPPESIVIRADLPAERPVGPPEAEPFELIDVLPLLATLTRSEKLSLAGAASRREFRKGETVARQGDMLSALTVIRSGVVGMRCDGKDGGRLAPGDFFGEAGLLAGMDEACTLQALTRVTAWEIDQHAFAPLLANRPTMAEDLAQALSARPLPDRIARQQGIQRERRARVLRKAIEKIFSDGIAHALKR
jgi:small-conductance mechanosensitive channel/CRP-like cAMP-binding protein